MDKVSNLDGQGERLVNANYSRRKRGRKELSVHWEKTLNLSLSTKYRVQYTKRFYKKSNSILSICCFINVYFIRVVAPNEVEKFRQFVA